MVLNDCNVGDIVEIKFMDNTWSGYKYEILSKGILIEIKKVGSIHPPINYSRGTECRLVAKKPIAKKTYLGIEIIYPNKLNNDFKKINIEN